jgi:hypothetical protein
MIRQRLDVADRHGAVGNRDGHIDQHPPRVVAGAAFPQPVGGLTQRRRQTDPVSELGQQHRPGVRHHPGPVRRDDRRRATRCTVHARSASLVRRSWSLSKTRISNKTGAFALSRPVSHHKISGLLKHRG